ncbi:MAG: c-type cytochrome [Candidatus Binataceae bacterium]
MVRSVISFGAAVALLMLIGVTAHAQDESPNSGAGAPAQTTGKQDFMKYCARCHGANGKGHGPDLYILSGVHPSNLTVLTEKNGGVFPSQKVVDIIDGRKVPPSHKRLDMPFWGVQFQPSGKEFTAKSDALAKARIDRLANYIKSIQVEQP